jgi:hypothetical protein
LQDFLAYIKTMAAQHGDSAAVAESQLQPQIAAACGQQVAGDPNVGCQVEGTTSEPVLP